MSRECRQTTFSRRSIRRATNQSTALEWVWRKMGWGTTTNRSSSRGTSALSDFPSSFSSDGLDGDLIACPGAHCTESFRDVSKSSQIMCSPGGVISCSGRIRWSCSQCGSCGAVSPGLKGLYYALCVREKRPGLAASDLKTNGAACPQPVQPG
ncbi:hypothetical protein DPMN_130613 [Dreissena polymorpha]|uniref:Uncharacterized protein n=1 Tax=Dreissena polymorpha TaxID=45954 RepID=A0A9D4H376_DREPO|nr:hypothetical protein DPMN_130613 [Dreissena polymorpha]